MRGGKRRTEFHDVQLLQCDNCTIDRVVDIRICRRKREQQIHRALQPDTGNPELGELSIDALFEWFACGCTDQYIVGNLIVRCRDRLQEQRCNYLWRTKHRPKFSELEWR